MFLIFNRQEELIFHLLLTFTFFTIVPYLFHTQKIPG